MDVDMDLDLVAGGDNEDFDQCDVEAESQPSLINPFDGTVTGAADIAFEKVHLRGLDNVDQTQLQNYISSYFDSPLLERIEWVDDTSANLVYTSTSAASEALRAFSSINATELDPLTLRPAQNIIITRQDGAVESQELQIRQATSSDVKRKRAREASKFYLMNPDKDPQEHRQRDRRARNRGNGEAGDYHRTRYDDREHKRRREQEDNFDESMYDDGPRRRSASEDRRKRVRFGRQADQDRDLFPGREVGRLRDRSASPMRGDGDGRYGFGSDPEHDTRVIERRVRQRSDSPPRTPGRELFPKKAGATSKKELFPSKVTTTRQGEDLLRSKELFPHKTKLSNHRRTGAIDASPEQYSSSPKRPKSLAERIAGGSGSSLADRVSREDGVPLRSLADRITKPGEDAIKIKGNSGVNIRGSAMLSDDFSIRGASGNPSQLVEGTQDLFPGKANAGKELFAGGSNSGKELFGEKLKGRGVARRTAASYF